MFLAILTLITALSISAVAIYYSVAGLVAIFAAAAVPIMIMGGTLEIGKLVTAVWLHRYWEKATWWLKTYLSIAVIVLMIITSMGIFGFLSKAHIEQTSASTESIEKIERLTTEITRQEIIIKKAERKIDEAENQGANKNDTIQDQIDREQKRIDTAYTRIQPLVAEQQKIIQQETERKDGKLEPYLAQISSIDEDLATLSDLLNRRDSESIRRLQSIVGTRVDGNYGSRTAKQVENYREGLIAKRESILNTITKLEEKDSPIIKAANEEIKRLRDIAEKEIADSNKVINKLRSEIGSVAPDNNTALIEENLLKIKNANKEIDTLTEEKYKLEAEYRALEAEVGPIKYIAEFIYGEEADRDLLEEAVRWVIIILIVVFDPLAVLLLIASQYTFEFARPNNKDKWREYEKQRAAMIVANEGPKDDTPPNDDPDPEPDDDRPDDGDQPDTNVQTDDVEDNERDGEASDETSIHTGQAVEETEKPVSNTTELDKGHLATGFSSDWENYNTQEPKLLPAEADEFEKKEEESSEELNDLEQWNKWVEAAEAEVARENKGMLFGEDNLKKAEIKDRANIVKEQANDENWTEARNNWQNDNPDEDANNYRQAFISGRIHSLPWESYLPAQKKKRAYITKVADKQVRIKT